MRLYQKTLQETKTILYLMYPDGDCRTPFKRRCISFITDLKTEREVREQIEKLELDALCDEHELILCFPVIDQAWDRLLPDEILKIHSDMERSLGRPDNMRMQTNEVGIPTVESMMNFWHPMNDTRYFVGLGSGASAVATLAARAPAHVTAILIQKGDLLATTDLTNSPVPACLLDPDPRTKTYFLHANGNDKVTESDGFTVYESKCNPWQKTWVKEKADLTDDLMRWVWRYVFAPVRRTNTSVWGDVEPAMDLKKAGFEMVIEDGRLGDGKLHTWFVHVPEAAKHGHVPMVMFFHGGTDNPTEAADMSKLHELGQREGFITVYPWGSNRCSWNNNMEDEGENDALFGKLLMDYMLENYPVDRERVYMSGFSNGAAMAQVMALLYPDQIAGLFHIDSNWPGAYGGRYLAVDERDVLPFRLGFERKKEYDYLMPVWYTYGSREMSFPIYRASTQQNQYDLWKKYNHIRVTETPAVGEANPSGCGATGETRELVYPTSRHPHHCYQVERFYTEDDQHLNLYNLVIMYPKAHEIAQMDAELGWRYVSRFRRLADGSLGIDPQ